MFLVNLVLCVLYFFFFNDTATTEIYTLSLHDALPIFSPPDSHGSPRRTASGSARRGTRRRRRGSRPTSPRSEEHTSELQSRQYLVCRLLLEKKKKHKINLYQQNKYHASDTYLAHIYTH